jgi:sugar lactone lactonase YvrE
MLTWHRYGVRAWPTLVLIDPRGYVRAAVSGEGHGPALHQAVAALIEEAQSQGTLNHELVVRTSGGDALRRLAPARSFLAYPGKVASDGGDRLAIADTGHDRIVICRLDGTVERELTGLYQPQGIAFDGNRLIVADTGNDRVVTYDLSPTADSRLPTALTSGISSPWDVALWQGGIAVAEAGRHRLWWIAPDGAASVLAGTSGENIVDGPALEALLAQPSGLSVAPDGALLFADSEVSALRQLRDGIITTLVGKGLFEWGNSDGDAETARLQHPLGVAAAPDGSVYVADTFNSLLRVWRDGALSTLPVRGLDEPGGLCLLPDGRLAVADTNNHRVLLVDPATGAAVPLPLPEAADPDHPPARDLPENATVTVTLSLDLEGDDLDARDGPPVRVAVSAEPPGLLGPGARAWAADALPATVELRTARGAGALLIDAQAASCLGAECRLHRRRITLPVRLRAEAGETALRL